MNSHMDSTTLTANPAPANSAGKAKPELPVQKVNRLGWELAHALNEYSDGNFKAVIYPTSVRPEFAVGFCILNLPDCSDPLFDLIEAYRKGVAKFMAIPEEDLAGDNEERLVMKTYGVHLNAIEAWDTPALTRKGAIAAIKLLEQQHDESFISVPLIHAIRGYLEAQEGVL